MKTTIEMADLKGSHAEVRPDYDVQGLAEAIRARGQA
jgi:hypothetical protein